MSITQPIPFAPFKMQDAATAGNGQTLILSGQQEQLNLWLQSSGTTSGGTISIEEAFFPPETPGFSGTWSVITTVSASTITGGAAVMIHSPANYWAVRARISSNITGGGTITVYGWGS